MAGKLIKQKIKFTVPPGTVFELLMSAKLHAAFTGAGAKIDARVGGRFSTYDHYIEGQIVELDAGKKIIQTWRARDWPDGHYSQATFLFKKIASGTELTFTQSGVPAEQVDAIREGWKDFYWGRMQEFIRQNSLEKKITKSSTLKKK